MRTAQIAPSQRRGVEVPEDLLERVTRAHFFWRRQAEFDERYAAQYAALPPGEQGDHSDAQVGCVEPLSLLGCRWFLPPMFLSSAPTAIAFSARSLQEARVLIPTLALHRPHLYLAVGPEGRLLKPQFQQQLRPKCEHGDPFFRQDASLADGGRRVNKGTRRIRR